MSRVPARTEGTQASQGPSPLGTEPSAYGGVLLLAQAWAALGAPALAGLRWQGAAGPLLLFALVVAPLLPAVSSVRAVALCFGTGSEVLTRTLGWGAVLTQRRLARFVASRRHDWGVVLGSMARLLASHPATALRGPRAIVVDSTTIEKRYGPCLPHRHPVYDAVQQRLVDGYAVVTGCVVSASGGWPLGLLPHAPTRTDGRSVRRRRKAQPGEAPSKLDLALELVHLAVRAGVGCTAPVLADSAFCVMWWLREVAATGRHWLVSTRQDRRLRIGATVQSFAAWVAQQAPQPLDCTETGARRLWCVALPPATLLDKGCHQKGLACQPVYFERRDRQGRVIHRWYLLTSQVDWDVATVWQYWQWRWPIEVLHRDAKQHLRMAAFHTRTWEAIVALLACTSLRLSLLVFIRAFDPACTAFSTGALVTALQQAACLLQPAAPDRVQVLLPNSLPATRLWNQVAPPLPAPFWPLVTQPA